MTTYYRKYRPQRIEDLDLSGVKQTLSASLKSGKLAHAYLFVGPRGSGKTSAARILAKAVNCEKTRGKGEPCLECASCKSIENGGFVDVIEIDAASHRGIDAIRDLRDKIGLAPAAGEKKVYIIDEVHMLTSEAFNALLKTLEEPPEHAMFFLCTTEEHKVPETIVSRCVRVGFVKATDEEVMRSLKKVVDGEELKVEGEVLGLLARSVDGSFREGHKLLEQLVGSGEKITMGVVEKLLGQAKGVDITEVAKAMLEGRTAEVLRLLGLAEKSGVEWLNFSEKLLEYLRAQMKAHYGIGKLEVRVGVERVKTVAEMVAAATKEIKTAMVPALPLELVAVELTVESADGNGKKKPKQANEKKMMEEVEPEEMNTETKRDEIKADMTQVARNVSLDEVVNKWEGIIQVLSPLNHSVAGLLRSCRPKKIENHFLVIEAYYKFHKDQLEQETRRRMVEEALKREVGLPAVKFVLGERAKRAVEKTTEHNNVEVTEEDSKLAEAVEDVFGVEV